MALETVLRLIKQHEKRFGYPFWSDNPEYGFKKNPDLIPRWEKKISEALKTGKPAWKDPELKKLMAENRDLPDSMYRD